MRALALGMVLVVAAGCAAGSQASLQASEGGNVAAMLLGFWHGIIGPITLIGEIIDTVSPAALPWSVHFYEARNSSVLYDLGFYVGLVAGPSMLWTGASRRRGITLTQP